MRDHTDSAACFTVYYCKYFWCVLHIAVTLNVGDPEIYVRHAVFYSLAVLVNFNLVVAVLEICVRNCRVGSFTSSDSGVSEQDKIIMLQ
jgi:hypothetical protein